MQLIKHDSYCRAAIQEMKLSQSWSGPKINPRARDAARASLPLLLWSHASVTPSLWGKLLLICVSRKDQTLDSAWHEMFPNHLEPATSLIIFLGDNLPDTFKFLGLGGFLCTWLQLQSMETCPGCVMCNVRVFIRGDCFTGEKRQVRAEMLTGLRKRAIVEGKKKNNPWAANTVKPRLFDLCFTDKTFLIPVQRNMGKTSSYKPEISCNR